MNFKKVVVLTFIFLASGAGATELSKIDASVIGARLGTVRVCSDIATYTQYWQAKEIFDEYDQKATKYLTGLKDKNRLDSILDALKNTQLDLMDSTGKFNWSTTCRSVAENYQNGEFL